MYTMSPAILITFGAVIFGSVFTGGWWRIGVLTGYFAIFFIVETRILCSHCPYYSKEGIMLHCLANHGFIKFYRYHPEPMNLFEKILLIIGFVLFGTLPLLAQIPSIVNLSGALPGSRSIFITLLIGVSKEFLDLTIGIIYLSPFATFSWKDILVNISGCLTALILIYFRPFLIKFKLPKKYYTPVEISKKTTNKEKTLEKIPQK